MSVAARDMLRCASVAERSVTSNPVAEPSDEFGHGCRFLGSGQTVEDQHELIAAESTRHRLVPARHRMSEVRPADPGRLYFPEIVACAHELRRWFVPWIVDRARNGRKEQELLGLLVRAEA